MPVAYILIDKGAFTGDEVAEILSNAYATEGKCANCGCDLDEEAEDEVVEDFPCPH